MNVPEEEAVAARHQAEIEAQREEFHRELMRKELRIAELELGPEGAERHRTAMEVAAKYEATLSWRLTKPIRAIRSMPARARRLFSRWR
jgi:hypothetical protein